MRISPIRAISIRIKTMNDKLVSALRLRLIAVISFAVLFLLGAVLTVVFGMRMSYVAMGIFAAVTLAALYLLPMSIISYVDHRIIVLVVRAAGCAVPQDISALAEAAGMTKEGAEKYIQKAQSGGYLQPQDSASQ